MNRPYWLFTWCAAALCLIPAISYAKPDAGQIALACDLPAIGHLRDPNTPSLDMDLKSRAQPGRQGYQWLVFGADEYDAARETLFDCARTLPHASAYRIRLSGRLTSVAYHFLVGVYGSLSAMQAVSDRVPDNLIIELDHVTGPLDGAGHMAEDARYGRIPTRTQIPQGASCDSLACALLLAGGRNRLVKGDFRFKAIGYGYSGDNAYTLEALRSAASRFEQLGVSPDVVERFKQAPLDHPVKVSQEALESLGLVTDPE